MSPHLNPWSLLMRSVKTSTESQKGKMEAMGGNTREEAPFDENHLETRRLITEERLAVIK